MGPSRHTQGQGQRQDVILQDTRNLGQEVKHWLMEKVMRKVVG